MKHLSKKNHGGDRDTMQYKKQSIQQKTKKKKQFSRLHVS